MNRTNRNQRRVSRDVRRARDRRLTADRRARVALLRRNARLLSAITDRLDSLTLWERDALDAGPGSQPRALDYSQISGKVIERMPGSADPNRRARRWREVLCGQDAEVRAVEAAARALHPDPDREHDRREELAALVAADRADLLPCFELVWRDLLLLVAADGDHDSAREYCATWDRIDQVYGPAGSNLFPRPSWKLRALAHGHEPHRKVAPSEPSIVPAGRRAGAYEPVPAPVAPTSEQRRANAARERYEQAIREPTARNLARAVASLTPVRPEVWDPSDRGSHRRAIDRLRVIARRLTETS